eukprot:4601267-Lingulodinium_polyedra.AAC.1
MLHKVLETANPVKYSVVERKQQQPKRSGQSPILSLEVPRLRPFLAEMGPTVLAPRLFERGPRGPAPTFDLSLIHI